MDNSPLKTTISFCSSPRDQHYYPDQPFPADEISAFLHQFLLLHPQSSFYPPPFTPQAQSFSTPVNAGSSVLDPARDRQFPNNLIHFGGNIGDFSNGVGGNEPPDGREAEREEAPADELLPPPKPPSKRTRAAEVHNLSEKVGRPFLLLLLIPSLFCVVSNGETDFVIDDGMVEQRRRGRINEKMKALQKLIPNSNKTDKASMLDEAIEYLKQLQLQVQVLSMRTGAAGLHQMSHNNIAESFLQQQARQPLPASRLVKVKAEEAVSPMDEQKSPAAANGAVIKLGRQSSAASNVTHSMIRSSYY
ncbi:unnamed protein product [Linum tenue]|uniref:BHLH domain-containing protein n=1 Tax=Linum tenue TaxID=586396 RepID=A0AAV0R817_9ROSI|nr:unnamed protein product [Linum tenue]